MFKLNNKNIIVTGASQGIGMEIACSIASLGGVPLSNWNSENQGITRKFMDILFEYCNIVYPFKRLWNFKEKFNPHWQPMYLAIGSKGSKILPLLAVFRACILPKSN